MLDILMKAPKGIIYLRVLQPNIYRCQQIYGFSGRLGYKPYNVTARTSLDSLCRRLVHNGTSNLRLEVISPGGHHGPKCVLLHAKRKKYLFNCGENTWRYMMHERMSVIPYHLSGLFITHNSWSNIGGFQSCIMNMLLPVPKIKKLVLHIPPSLDLVGPQRQINRFQPIKSADVVDKFWAKGQYISVDRRDHNSGPYTDGTIQVEYVPLQCDDIPAEMPDISVQSEMLDTYDQSEMPDTSDQSEMYHTTDQSTATNPDLNVTEFEIDMPVSSNGLETEKLNSVTRRHLDISLTYIVKQCGQNRKPNTGPIVVLECPSERFLQSLVTSEQLLNLCDDPKTVPEIIVHMSPVDVVDHPDYQAFMQRFDETTTHLMLNERSSIPICPNSLEDQRTLTMLNPNFFPGLSVTKSETEISKSVTGNIVQAERNLQCCIRGTNLGLRWISSVEDLVNYTGKHTCIKNEKCPATVAKIAQLSNSLKKFEKQNTERYPEVVFLGTGGSYSTKYRNVTCILVHTSPDSCIILDCGEGAITQLVQYYGDQTDEVLCKLHVIFVSHIHMDHHRGSVGLIEARNAARNRSGLPQTMVYMIAPYMMARDIGRFFASVCKVTSNLVQLISYRFFESGKEDAVQLVDSIKKSLCLNECNIVHVTHVAKASYGIVLVGEAGWKLVYSGDTAPSDNLVQAGKDCDLLIHEATFDNDRKDMARIVYHSTVDDALSVGKSMNARYVMLTHFCAINNLVPLCITKNPPNVGIAFDFMRVTLADLPSVQMHEDALLSIFQTDYHKSAQKNVYASLKDQSLLKKRRISGIHAASHGVNKVKVKTRRKYFEQELTQDQVEGVLELLATRKYTKRQGHDKTQGNSVKLNTEIMNDSLEIDNTGRDRQDKTHGNNLKTGRMNDSTDIVDSTPDTHCLRTEFEQTSVNAPDLKHTDTHLHTGQTINMKSERNVSGNQLDTEENGEDAVDCSKSEKFAYEDTSDIPEYYIDKPEYYIER